MKRYFKGINGNAATINEHGRGQVILRVITTRGVCAKCQKYSTYQGALAALGGMGGCWQEIPKQKGR